MARCRHSIPVRTTGRVTRNDVTDGAKKRSILLAASGVLAYKLIRSLVQAEKPDSTPYEELVKIVKNHYDPKPSMIM